MAKYHLSANGPRPCHAEFRDCPLGEDSPHFTSLAEAKEAYNQKMTDTFGAFETVSRGAGEKIRQASYAGRERTLKFGMKVLESPAARAAVNTAYAIHTAPARARSLANRKVQALTRLAMKLTTKAQNHTLKVNSKIKEASKKQYDEARALANTAKEAAQYAGTKAVSSERKAAKLKLGQVMSDGSKIVSLRAHNDGSMSVVSTKEGRAISRQFKPGASASIRGKRTKLMEKMKNSETSSRLREASKVQKQVFVTLFGAHSKTESTAQIEQAQLLAGLNNRKKKDMSLYA